MEGKHGWGRWIESHWNIERTSRVQPPATAQPIRWASQWRAPELQNDDWSMLSVLSDGHLDISSLGMNMRIAGWLTDKGRVCCSHLQVSTNYISAPLYPDTLPGWGSQKGKFPGHCHDLTLLLELGSNQSWYRTRETQGWECIEPEVLFVLQVILKELLSVASCLCLCTSCGDCKVIGWSWLTRGLNDEDSQNEQSPAKSERLTIWNSKLSWTNNEVFVYHYGWLPGSDLKP